MIAAPVDHVAGGVDDADVLGLERIVGKRGGRHRDQLAIDPHRHVAGGRIDEVLGLHAMAVGDDVETCFGVVLIHSVSFRD
jgi:hypothetical protein